MAKQDPLQQSAKIDRAEQVLASPAASQPKPDMIDRLGDYIEKNHANPAKKIGAGHGAAMWRAGLKELAQALPAFNNGIQPVEEPGLAGVPTNIEVVREKGGDSPGIESRIKGMEIEPAQQPSPDPMERYSARVATPSASRSKEQEIERG